MKINQTLLLQRVALGIALVFVQTIASHAATDTWVGGDGDWATSSNWSTSQPDLTAGDTAVINNGGNVVYSVGGDFTVSNGTLEISNGSWTQAATKGSWIQLRTGGTILVDGGTFNQGGANTLINTAGGTFTVNSGTANLTSLGSSTGFALNINGGAVNFTGEYKPINGVTTMTGGTLKATNLSWDNTTGVFNFSGGTIDLSGAGPGPQYDIYSSALGYLNFTTGSSGRVDINISTLSLADLTLLENTLTADFADGAIRYNDTIDTTDLTWDASNGTDLFVYSTGVAPEPSTYALLIGGLFLLFNLRRVANRSRKIAE